MSLSPKPVRRQVRQASLGFAERRTQEENGEDGRRHHEKTDDLDEEFQSSSADEGKWKEYYKNGGNDNVATMISDPARATPLERRWLAGMSEGKEPHLVRQFER